MFFQFDLTVPKNTSQGGPELLECPAATGVIERVEITFPPGCMGLVGVTVSNRAHQIYPSNPDGWFVADNYTIAFDDQYDFDSPPFLFILRGYNLDEIYDHKILFRFGIREFEMTPSARIAYAINKAVIEPFFRPRYESG